MPRYLWDDEIEPMIRQELLLHSGFAFWDNELEELDAWERAEEKAVEYETYSEDTWVVFQQWMELRANLLVKCYCKLANAQAVVDTNRRLACGICAKIGEDVHTYGKLRIETLGAILAGIYDSQKREERKRLSAVPKHWKKKKVWKKRFHKWESLPNDIWFEIASYQSFELRDIYRMSVVSWHFHKLFHWKMKGIHTDEKVTLYKHILANMYECTRLVPAYEEAERIEMKHLYKYASKYGLLSDFGTQAVQREMKYNSHKKEPQSQQLFRLLSLYDRYMKCLHANRFGSVSKFLLLPFHKPKWRGQIGLFRCMLSKLDRKASTDLLAVDSLRKSMEKVRLECEENVSLMSEQFELFSHHSWVSLVSAFMHHSVNTPQKVAVLVQFIRTHPHAFDKSFVSDVRIQTSMREMYESKSVEEQDIVI